MFDPYLWKDKAKRNRCRTSRCQMCRMTTKDKRKADERKLPLPDVGLDAELYDIIDEIDRGLDEYYRKTISSEQWRRYTTPQPFCTVPEGGANPQPKGVRKMTRNPFRKPTERAAEVNLIKAFAADVAKAKLSDELPPEPTFEEQLAKAGGRILTVPNATEVADWHEQDPTI